MIRSIPLLLTLVLVGCVIKGKGAMPPRGAVANVSDAELRGAVEHMVAAAK